MADDLIGTQIGGYQIIEVAGRGGMAVVYRARQVSMKRIVAIKVLPRQFLTDETYMQRFNREVHIASQLEHRNIVPVHDYGEANGQPYIVMRYMDGGSVDDLIRRAGALSMARVQDIIAQIAPALDYAHSKNVLHRDLKPSNILLDDDGGFYLTDFGIARLMGDTEPGMSIVTTQGVIGTPSYMSPEQAQGKALDGRSDLYSLGVSIFEMATGSRPFEGETPYSIAVLQVTTPPPAPRTINPDIPPAVERVILKSMNKQATDRYPTATALAEALAQAITAPTLDKTTPNNPILNLLDTQPGFPRPPMPISPPPPSASTPAPQNVYTPAPMGYPATQAPPSAALRRPRPRRQSSLFISILVGGILGCALLSIVALLIALVIGGVVNDSGTLVTPTATTAREVGQAVTATATIGITRSAVPTRTVLGGVRTQIAVSATVPVGARITPTGISGLGSLVFYADRDNNFDLYRLDLATRIETRLTEDASIDMYPSVSPDGDQIIFQSDRDGDFDIYLMNSDGTRVRRVTNNNVTDRIPTWMPDGDAILFSSDTRGDGTHDLIALTLQNGEERVLYSDGERNGHPRVSLDGRYVIFTSGRPDNAATWDIKRLELETDEVITLTENEVKDWSSTFTPSGDILYLTSGLGFAAIALMDIDGGGSQVLYDGEGYEWGLQMHPQERTIVFNSDVTGRDELYLMSADGSNVRPITDNGGAAAVWLSSQ